MMLIFDSVQSMPNLQTLDIDNFGISTFDMWGDAVDSSCSELRQILFGRLNRSLAGERAEDYTDELNKHCDSSLEFADGVSNLFEAAMRVSRPDVKFAMY